MSQDQNEFKLDGLPDGIGEPLRFLYEQLRTTLIDNFAGITVVGSALTSDYRAGASDINTVVLLERHRMGALASVASLAKPGRKKHLSPPLMMTTSYIERSRDVFGIEFLDFQLTHQTIFGDDPFVALTFAKPDVRLQCERELKAMLIRLRQGYIAAAGHKRLVRDVLISAAKGLAPLLRAMLWLKDIERPTTMQATLDTASTELGLLLNGVVTAQQWRYEKPRLTPMDLEITFESLYTAVDKLAGLVDEMEVA